MKRFLLGIVITIMLMMPVCRVYADSGEAISPTPTEAVKTSDGIEVKDTDKSFSEEGGKAYEDLRERSEKDTLQVIDQLTGGGGGTFDKDYVKLAWIYTFYVYDVLSGVYPGLFIFSITIGFIIAMLSSKNKKRRRFAVYFLCLGLPITVTAFVYGIPYLYLAFR